MILGSWCRRMGYRLGEWLFGMMGLSQVGACLNFVFLFWNIYMLKLPEVHGEQRFRR